MDFQITAHPIDPAAHKATLSNARAGACVIFEGWVRDRNSGEAVASLEYEAYPLLAEKEGQKILQEASENFPIVAASASHRVGHLNIGDLAVWVGVVSEHRAAGFDACRYIIDEIKTRVPIWKKEHYISGTSEWINCATKVSPDANS